MRREDADLSSCGEAASFLRGWKVFYMNLLTSGKLNNYLADIDNQAEEMFSRLVKQLAEKENVTEKLKAENQMMWVQKMNIIRSRVIEVVNTYLIYNT